MPASAAKPFLLLEDSHRCGRFVPGEIHILPLLYISNSNVFPSFFISIVAGLTVAPTRASSPPYKPSTGTFSFNKVAESGEVPDNRQPPLLIQGSCKRPSTLAAPPTESNSRTFPVRRKRSPNSKRTDIAQTLECLFRREIVNQHHHGIAA